MGQGKRKQEVKSNITDNESAKMATSKGIIQGYNGVATVDKKHQVIIDAQAFGEGQEHHTLAPVIEAVKTRYQRLNISVNIYMTGTIVSNRLDDLLDPIVQAALIHAQFELIHPFDDGNGRIGRILIPLFLVRRGCIVSPSLYINGYLETNRDLYYQCLENITKEGDWLRWVEFFLNAVVKQSENNLILVRNIIDLYEQKKREISELLHTDQAIHIVDMLFDTPVFRANELHKRLKIQRQRAAQCIRSLKDAGIIVELRPSKGRKPALLSFEDLLQITDRQ